MTATSNESFQAVCEERNAVAKMWNVEVRGDWCVVRTAHFFARTAKELGGFLVACNADSATWKFEACQAVEVAERVASAKRAWLLAE